MLIVFNALAACAFACWSVACFSALQMLTHLQVGISRLDVLTHGLAFWTADVRYFTPDAAQPHARLVLAGGLFFAFVFVLAMVAVATRPTA